MNEYLPASLVLVVWAEFVETSTSLTEAFTMDAPDGSVTMPEIEPVEDCAQTGTELNRSSTPKQMAKRPKRFSV
jgi:hypothetical protein